MTQYTDYGTIPQIIRDVVANKCSLLDEYILFQTGQYEYTAFIREMVTGKVTKLTFLRPTNYGSYVMVEAEGSWDFVISNEVYCYSNVGLGAALDLPVMEGVQSHAAVILTVVLLFLVVFRSTLFPFIKRK